MKCQTKYLFIIVILALLTSACTGNKAILSQYEQYLGHYENGEYQLALPYAVKSLELIKTKRGVDDEIYGTMLNNLGQLYRVLGQYEESLPVLLKAVSAGEKLYGRLHTTYGIRLVNLATLYHQMGKYELASTNYEEALSVLENTLGKAHAQYAITLNNLALLYKNMGNLEKASTLFEEALLIAEKTHGKKHLEYSIKLYNLASVYKAWGDFEKSSALLEEALLITEEVKGKDHPDYGIGLNNLAAIYQNLGEYDKAKLLFEEAWIIADKTLGKHHPDYGISLNNLANLYNEMGEYSKAIPLFEEALSNTDLALGKENSNYGVLLTNLALLYQNMGNFDKADQLFNESKSNVQSNLNNMLALLSEDALQKYLQTVDFKFKVYHSFYLKHYHKKQKLASDAFQIELTLKGLILNSSIQMRQSILNSKNTEALVIFDNWCKIKLQLANEYTKPKNERSDVQKLEDEANSLEAKLVKLSKTFQQAFSSKERNWKDIQLALQENEVAIEFASFEYFDGKYWTDSILYTALVLRKDAELPVMIKLFEEAQLAELLTKKTNLKPDFISNLYRGAQMLDNTGNADGAKLYELIWKPLEEYLNPGDHIYFSPSGLLHQIAFSALSINENECLSDKYQLNQLSTTAKLLEHSSKEYSLPKNITLFGGIQYEATGAEMLANAHEGNQGLIAKRSLPDDLARGGTWSFLSGTLREVETIQNIAAAHNTKAIVYSGLQATEENYQSLSSANSPDVLHIATHGFFFPDPEQIEIEATTEADNQAYCLSDNPLNRSGLILSGGNRAWQGQTPPEGVADGILTAYEASNVTLNNTQLVVLSACETGLGEIQGSEGVFGLQRAFKAAGAEYLIMSLWKVPDMETAEFMESFYSNWFSGITIEEAFRQTQLYMKNKYTNDPYKWAAFILLR